MEEINLYHLVREHPVISFLVCAIPVMLLTFFTMSKALAYWENRREEEKKQIKDK